MGMKVDVKFQEINARQTPITEREVVELKMAAEKDNMGDSGWCCSGPGTAGTDRLRDLYVANPKKFINVRPMLAQYLHLTDQGVSKDCVSEKK